MLSADDIRNTNFTLVPTISGRNANPEFILIQLTNMMPLLQNNPRIKQVGVTRYLLDQIDPMITELITINPETEGLPGSDVPLVQTVEQLVQAVQELLEQVGKNTEFLTVQAQNDVEAGRAAEAQGQAPGPEPVAV